MKLFELLILTFLGDVRSTTDNFSSLYSSMQSKSTGYFWNEALNLMSFHRNKMNEYLCKNYVANEIIQNYKNESANEVQKKINTFKNSSKNSRLVRESLLADPGSQKYKDWLSRSNTLEDIYRQFEHTEKDHVDHLGHGEVINGHEGDITGYALLDQKHVYSKPAEYGEDLHSHKYHAEKDEDYYHEKGLKLKELFHFALTAIAFLAFACFMIEVIMCLMEVPQQVEPDYVLVPTTTGGTGHASKLGSETSGGNRQERALILDPISLEILNNMSSKVLSSIDALAALHEGNSRCLQKALCQNSKYSKSLRGIQKIWLPLWSFGLSWISERLRRRNNITYDGLNTLENLKATVMGLGSRDCHVLYPKCVEKSRRKKRKKKEAGICLNEVCH